MFKNFLLLFVILLLTNCSSPGTALLGPAFTGVTTKSAAQTTLSFGTNQIIQNIKETSEKGKQEVIKIVKRFDEFTKDLDNKNFYASVKSLYLQDQQQKKKKILFHR